MKVFFKALITLFFQRHANANVIKGGSGHYNEQCHPQTYN